MFNKDLFNRICNVSCSWEELKEFVIAIDKKEFDVENPFEKYYSVDRIISAIEKYQAKQINAKFLAYWMNAYDWIIMGGFKIEYEDESVALKDFLIWTIADWLDSLSFFDDSDDWYNLEEYKNTYKVLDSVLQDLPTCKAVFSELDEEDFTQEDAVVVLIMNDKAKYFIKVYGDLDYNNEKVKFEKIKAIDLKKRAQQLLDFGYKELKYCNWEDID